MAHVHTGFKNDLSPQQAEALKAFQDRLDNDIQPIKENGKAIILWGVELVANGPKVDIILLKFLRAREFKVEDAATMLVTCLNWRKTFGVEHIFEEKFPDAITSLGFIHKTDKQGRPVMYNTYGNINIKEAFDDQGGIDKFVRWRVQLMEKAILRLDMDTVEDMVIIHDYNGASFLKIDKNMKLASKTLIALFQDYYPELLAKKFFVHIPWFFETVYNMVSVFVSDRTKSKFVICSKSSVREKLLANIPVENLPQEYGGLSQLDHKLITSETTSEPAPHTFTTNEKVVEVTIEPGAKHELEKKVEAGATLVWEFTLLAGEVTFGVRVPSGPEVVPAKKLEQHAGTHTATEAATYVLTWDNAGFFAKKLTLFYKVFVAEKAANNNNTNDDVAAAAQGEEGAGNTTTTTTTVSSTDASTLD